MTTSTKPPTNRLLRGIIIGMTVLIAVAIMTPNFIRCRCQSSLMACKSNLKNIGTALEMYAVDHGGYPRELLELTPVYLKELPKCPSRKSYGADFTGEGYLVYCPGGWHGRGSLYGTHSDASHREVMTVRRFPAFSASEGVLPDRILFTSDSFDRKPEVFVAACRNFIAGTLGVLVLFAAWRALRRRRISSQTPAFPA